MSRKIWAFIGFNAFAIYLISAFQANTAYLFDSNLIDILKISPFDLSPRKWGWGDHYIWRLFSGISVTAIVGFFAGAIAKNKSGMVALIANIPSVLVWSFMIYVFGFTDVEIETKTGYLVISIIAIPLTTYIAYAAGNYGELIQQQEFKENDILGIKGYHWIWAVIPLYWYSESLIFVLAKFIHFQIITWTNFSIIAGLLSFLMLIPIIAWSCPLYLVYNVLHGDLFRKSNSLIRSLANMGFLIIGMFVAQGIQNGCYWLYNKFIS